MFVPFKVRLSSITTVIALMSPCLVHGFDVGGNHLDFYSESVKADDGTSTGLLSETRFRVFPVKDWWAQPYVGAYTNSYHHGPVIGSMFRLHPTIVIDAMIEQRWVYNEEQKGQPETRYGLIAGDWREFAPKWFSESYAESILIPRLNNTPVTTGWTRVFHRTELLPLVVFDPFIQLWARSSPQSDLGQSGLEVRPGIRLAWTPPSTHVGLHIYQRAKVSPQEPSELEAMLVLWGELK